jgi:small neutral amino acid transporter SnatA (MarC family)
LILFLIAIKMIFASTRDLFRGEPSGEPFLVPLAVPLIAGPSAAATVLLTTIAVQMALTGIREFLTDLP